MKNWIALVILLLGFTAEARTLLVSDVDDTIKLAHVKDITEAIRFSRDDVSRFAGMNALYDLIVNDQPDLEIVYLSNAPNWLMGNTHRRFLLNGKFPSGTYIPRTDLSADFHKLTHLRRLINEVKPDKVILLGDNGERDAEFYNKISLEFAHKPIQFYQFIRIVYSNNFMDFQAARPLGQQVGFVTPLEVSFELEKAGLLTSSSVQWMIDNFAQSILMAPSYSAGASSFMANGDVVFPYFVNCRDLAWSWDDSLSRFAIMKDVKGRIFDRCKLKP
ncbi:phosphatase domain-containing protein [Bdellovibrio reynosensis]|uniref:DUF2183 domain-containing protein n=1 Tax=Bdellovibrio reynosensis TaxID=2835041 RepID=A0ABY4CE67_9BACT|nr:phosphatase domain-containing protein [Bdellovibrio reynosensis]UOF02051.1 DUF2183 domain-containing protein [Bdellovibrio reynosensis]